MNKEEIAEIAKKYMPNDKDMLKLSEKCYKNLTFEKYPENHPIAIIVAGQTGAGKTSVINYSKNQLNNSIVHDFDYFRSYFPYFEFLKDKYKDNIAQITNYFANILSKIVAKKLIENHFNLIFHKNFQSDIIIEDTLKLLRKQNYLLIIRILAVNLIESKLSVIERAKMNYKKYGWYRFSDIQYQNNSYNSLLNTVESIENQNIYDCMQVFIRGENEEKCYLLYSRNNNTKYLKIINNNNYKNLEMSNYNFEKFDSTTKAIVFGRESSKNTTMKTAEKRLLNLKTDMSNFEKIFIEDIEKMLNENIFKE